MDLNAEHSYGEVDPEIAHTTLSPSHQATVAPTTYSGWESNFCASGRAQTNSEASDLADDRTERFYDGVAAME